MYKLLCANCHGEKGQGAGDYPALVGGQGTLQSKELILTVGSDWRCGTTVWDYARRAMRYERTRGREGPNSARRRCLRSESSSIKKLSIRMFAGRRNHNLVFLSATSSCPVTNPQGPLFALRRVLCHPKMAVAERSEPELVLTTHFEFGEARSTSRYQPNFLMNGILRFLDRSAR
jgi:hypothetical protein